MSETEWIKWRGTFDVSQLTKWIHLLILDFVFSHLKQCNQEEKRSLIMDEREKTEVGKETIRWDNREWGDDKKSKWIKNVRKRRRKWFVCWWDGSRLFFIGSWSRPNDSWKKWNHGCRIEIVILVRMKTPRDEMRWDGKDSGRRRKWIVFRLWEQSEWRRKKKTQFMAWDWHEKIHENKKRMECSILAEFLLPHRME